MVSENAKDSTTSAEAGLPLIDEPPVVHLRPRIEESALTHRQLVEGPFWQKVPAYHDVDEAQFLNHKWQERNAITTPEKLIAAVQDTASSAFIDDVRQGFARAPMAVRISPYLMSLIDWERPYDDPVRRQFLPVASQTEPDHPMLTLDSLHEQGDAPTPGLTHRYPDKVLFLTLDTCPVYCRFCTRSYAVGLDTENVEKVSIKATTERWRRAFQYLEERVDVEDVVISGGDAYRLKPKQILEIGERLLGIPHIRRFRFATKGIAIQPMKILSDHEWTDAVTHIAERGRKLHKDVCIHTHFNHGNEVTDISRRAMNLLHERGVVVRNQSVMQNGVNDTPDSMLELCRRLAYINVHPYYVYVHDLVRGTEDLRTSVATGIAVEKYVRGSVAGFNTPTVVVDAPGGGGKRDCHSYELYDRETGISVYSAPSVKPDQLFLYFDPLRTLAPSARADWQDDGKRQQMIGDAKSRARANMTG